MKYFIQPMIFDYKRDKDAYFDGLREGVQLFAWWKDGEQMVGTSGKTLNSALVEIDKNYLRAQVHHNETKVESNNSRKEDNDSSTTQK